jgi:hypothetical protein
LYVGGCRERDEGIFLDWEKARQRRTLYLRPEQVCKPFKYGGLDVKDLNTQGWLLPTDQNMPWQGLDGLGVLEFFLVSSFSFFESLIPAVCSLGSNFVKHFCRLYKSGTRFAYS